MSTHPDSSLTPMTACRANSRADPSPQAPPASDRVETCLFCSAPTYGVHCKRICPNCGYREDCSDLFPA